MMKRHKRFRKRFWMKRFIGGGIIAMLFSGFAVKILWNALIPVLFGGPLITFFQALGILLLAKLLFGGGRKCGGHHGCQQRGEKREYWRQKMEEKMECMSPEEKEKFRKGFMKGSRWEVNVFEVDDEEENENGDDPGEDSDENKKE